MALVKKRQCAGAALLVLWAALSGLWCSAAFAQTPLENGQKGLRAIALFECTWLTTTSHQRFFDAGYKLGKEFLEADSKKQVEFSDEMWGSAQFGTLSGWTILSGYPYLEHTTADFKLGILFEMAGSEARKAQKAINPYTVGQAEFDAVRAQVFAAKNCAVVDPGSGG